jgi:hypothetical protein
MTSAGIWQGLTHQRKPTTTLPKMVSPVGISRAWACDRFGLGRPNEFRLIHYYLTLGPLVRQNAGHASGDTLRHRLHNREQEIDRELASPADTSRVALMLDDAGDWKSPTCSRW